MKLGPQDDIGPQDDVRSVAVSLNGELVATGNHDWATGSQVNIWKSDGTFVTNLPGPAHHARRVQPRRPLARLDR